ncbi:hypothetical protein [Olleya sp. UBA1516]|uniref:hypothetical protein n=1 Tax=Olleya sp. UBA1516 TaxID=1947013 RepID=UPI0025FA933C|nr:hypothetical protein [Olleya sp. UBA1516]|tara:strand:+ start:1671 stop:2159 length:489 start_codon:yes stop_codon:yes gene_type:complete
MKSKNQTKYDEWKEHLNSTKEKSDYSLKRMDLLVISISSGGLYVIFGTIKEFKTGKILVENSYLLSIAGILLLSSIIVNFFSQLSGYYANHYEEKYIFNELEILSNESLKEINKEKINTSQKTNDSFVKTCNQFTDIFNFISIITMIIGISFLTGFFLLSIF